MTITAYTYEADTHCIACTRKRFFYLYQSQTASIITTNAEIDINGIKYAQEDTDGNRVNALFSYDEWQEYDPGFLADNPTQYLTCGDCLEVIEEYTHIS